MWQTFLAHWNGVSIFLDFDIFSPPDLQLYTDASGSIGYGGGGGGGVPKWAVVSRSLASQTHPQQKETYKHRMAGAFSHLPCMHLVGSLLVGKKNSYVV